LVFVLIREFPISPFWGHPGCEVPHMCSWGLVGNPLVNAQVCAQINMNRLAA